MYEFAYHRPETLDEAAEIFASADDPQFLAGGMTMIPVMKQRLAMPSDVIDLSRIADMKGISADGSSLTIGAMTRHAEVLKSPDVKKAIPALSFMASEIGDISVRNRGTIGGSIANNDPTADYPAALLGLNASVRTTSREIAAGDFFTNMFETALEEGELVTRITFPVPEKAAYMKFRNPASRYAMAGVFVAMTGNGARVAVTGAGPCVFRSSEMEAALDGDFSAAALEGVTIPADEFNADMHASAEYRANLVAVLAKRAVAQIA